MLMTLVRQGNHRKVSVIAHQSSSTRRCATLCPRPLTRKLHHGLYRTWQTSCPSTGLVALGSSALACNFLTLLETPPSPRSLLLLLDNHCFPLTAPLHSHGFKIGMTHPDWHHVDASSHVDPVFRRSPTVRSRVMDVKCSFAHTARR